jgi:hypothetical protein
MGFVSVLTAVALGLSLFATPPAASAGDEEPMEQLLDAIAYVESHDNARALGDDGRAVGMYQIHRSYWIDGTRILGVDWDYRLAQDPQKARQVVRAYLRHYGSGKTLLEMARIHNGGPRGYERPSTLAYARKIEQVLHDDGAIE